MSRSIKRRPRITMAAGLGLLMIAGCGDAEEASSSLDPAGPPQILQVFARERVATTDDDGNDVVELHPRLAFGNHERIDSELDDRSVGAAAAAGDQRIRVVVDELLRGNFLEEIACADGSWSRVPVGTDPDDISRCAGPDLRRCTGDFAVCLGAEGPIGILDV